MDLWERHIYVHNSHTHSLGIAPFGKGAYLQASQDLKSNGYCFISESYQSSRFLPKLKLYMLYKNNKPSVHFISFWFI